MDIIEKRAGEIFLPGDVIIPLRTLEEFKTININFGPGVKQDEAGIVAFKAGVLNYKEKPCCVWIDTNQKRYVACKNDTVVGVITSRGTDSYKVDIGCSQQASLNNLAFEGATKRHKPNLKINDLVFAKLVIANEDMEPEISCVDENNRSNNLGPLNDGYLFSASLGLCRKLLKIQESEVLPLLGKHFQFEITVGINGRIWINSKRVIDIIAISNAISSSEFMENEQASVMVQQLADSIAGFTDED